MKNGGYGRFVCGGRGKVKGGRKKKRGEETNPKDEESLRTSLTERVRGYRRTIVCATNNETRK